MPETTHDYQGAVAAAPRATPAAPETANASTASKSLRAMSGFAEQSAALSTGAPPLPASSGAAESPAAQEPGPLTAPLVSLLESGASLDEVLSAIESADTAARQSAAQDPAVARALEGSGLAASEQTVVASSLQLGAHYWKSPFTPARDARRSTADNVVSTVGNDFEDHFVKQGEDGPLPADATLNCSDAILYAAFLAGHIDADKIREVYASGMVGAARGDFYAAVGYRSDLPQYDPDAGAVPSAGQSVFYVREGADVPSHVVLSAGGDRVLSIDKGTQMIMSTIEEQARAQNCLPVFGDPPWH